MTIDLSIIIPAYNEANAIRAGKLKRVAGWLSGQPFESELIVVDDGSQDDTAKLAKGIATRVVRIPHGGKAAAIDAGIRVARGDLVLFTDMDQATPITEAPRLLEALREGASVAIGSRGLVRAGAPAWRYALSWSQMGLRYALLALKLTDTQCGFKAFTRPAALDVLDHLVVYAPSRLGPLKGASVTSGFDVEFLFVGMQLGYSIRELPVRWNYQETRRVRLVRDAWRGVMDLLRIAWARLRGRYPKRARSNPAPESAAPLLTYNQIDEDPLEDELPESVLPGKRP